MKKISILFLMMLVKHSFADQNREYFLQANAAFQEGKASDALLLYDDLKVKDASVWFNKGLCYYILEKYPQALVAFRHAQRKANRRLLKKIDPILDVVQDKLQVPRDGKLYKISLLIACLEPFILIQFLFLLFFGIFIFFILSRKNKRLFFLVLITGLVVLGFLCIVRYLVDNQRRGIIVQDKVTLFAGPHKEFHGVADLHAGQEIKVVEQDQSWYKVDFHGVQGWLEKSECERII